MVGIIGSSADYLALELAELPVDSIKSIVGDVVDATGKLNSPPKTFVRIPAKASLSRVKRREVVAAMVDAAREGGADGIILYTDVGEEERLNVKELADVVSDVYLQTNGEMPLVACGDFRRGLDITPCIEAGATVVQIGTALVTEGLPVVRKLKNELGQILMNDSILNLAALVGTRHKKGKNKKKNPWKKTGA